MKTTTVLEQKKLMFRELWEISLKEIEKDISKANFSTWFKNTAILKTEEGIIYIAVPNEFVKEWLYKKFHKTILRSLVAQVPETRSVEYVVTRVVDIPQTQKEVIKKETLVENQEKKNSINELPFGELYINRNDNLNPRYTFSNFVVGTFNELAHAATQAVLGRPGVLYNPLFIYGQTGLGKTHLLQALGNEIKKRHPEVEVFYTNLERFSLDYISSVQNGNNKAHVFKEKYRKYDMLIMDDIQFIGKMEKTQDELFHLFNALFENNKQIVFSSDKHPNLIAGLEERLLSRFQQGMIVDIMEPDLESRIAIVKEKMRECGVDFEPEIINLIAENVRVNIRELEGIIKNIVLQSQMKKQKITITEIKNTFKNSMKKKRSISPKEIVSIVADYYNIDEALVYEKTRRKEVVETRQMIMYILREEFGISYPLIGQELGGKDHTTIIHSFKKIQRELKENPKLLQEFEELKSMFK
jgi:chromosomal replication initiator protein